MAVATDRRPAFAFHTDAELSTTCISTRFGEINKPRLGLRQPSKHVAMHIYMCVYTVCLAFVDASTSSSFLPLHACDTDIFRTGARLCDAAAALWMAAAAWVPTGYATCAKSCCNSAVVWLRKRVKLVLAVALPFALK
jgi:hypothetical protein